MSMSKDTKGWIELTGVMLVFALIVGAVVLSFDPQDKPADGTIAAQPTPTDSTLAAREP